MGWFKKGASSSSVEQKPKPAAPPATGPNASAKETANSKAMAEKRKEREKQKKAKDDMKLVVSGAKVQCPLCTVPIGTLMVTFPTPTIQGKPTATEQDNTKMSLLFTGTCTKSPNAAVPCIAVMQLGQWKDTGSLKVQDKAPLLLKSTIKCMFGGADIKIMHCGQMPMPPAVSSEGVSKPIKHSDLSFNTQADPARDVMGSGCESHPKEWKQILDGLKEEGVEIKFEEEEERYGFWPGSSKENPGQLILSKDASYSALLHEYQHHLDNKASGYPGPPSLFDLEYRIATERNAYGKEIELMKRSGQYETAEKLMENLTVELKRLARDFGSK